MRPFKLYICSSTDLSLYIYVCIYKYRYLFIMKLVEAGGKGPRKYERLPDTGVLTTPCTRGASLGTNFTTQPHPTITSELQTLQRNTSCFNTQHQFKYVISGNLIYVVISETGCTTFLNDRVGSPPHLKTMCFIWVVWMCIASLKTLYVMLYRCTYIYIYIYIHM